MSGNAADSAGMEPLRIGILGAARIADRSMVAPARERGHLLVAVAARDRARAESFAAAHGIAGVHDSYADLIADPEIDVVYNPLANALHAPWNIAAIEAGKHVLTEKPSASNADEAAEVRDATLARPRLAVLEGFHYLFHPLFQRVCELLESGELGDLQRVEASFTSPPPRQGDPRWSLRLAGGALMDLGCYNLHAHRMLAPWGGGVPRLLGARGGERAGLPGVDEWLDAELEFPNGATGSARCNMAGAGEQATLRIVGSRGELTAPSYVKPQRDDRLVVNLPSGERVERLGTRTSYAYQLDAFAAAVRDGTPLPIGPDDAVATMRLIDDCYRAAGFAPRPRYQIG